MRIGNTNHLKVFVLGTRGFPHVQGGVEKHCEELYPRLVELGCDVTVVTRSIYIPKDRRAREWNGVKFIHLWCPKSKSLEAIIHTCWGTFVARLRNPDLLHLHAIGPSLLTPLARLLGLRVVVTNHGPDYERKKWGKFAKLVLKLGEKVGTQYASKIIAISSGIKSRLGDKYVRDDIVFIPNGVNIPETVHPGGMLRDFSLVPRKYIFTACRFVPEKGLHNLIQAYCMIRNPECKLVIAGDADHETPYSRDLKRMAEKANGVILTGFVSGKSLAELFSNAGLFVLPSYYEGLPIALLEAIGYELPVLVSDIPPNKEVPLPRWRYFDVDNVSQLSQKIVELYAKGITEEEISTNRALLSERYNWDNIAQQTLSVYRSLSSN